MSTKTCSNNMVSPNDHVVMNHQNQTPHKWHMRPCSLQTRVSLGLGAAGQFLVCWICFVRFCVGFSFSAGCVLGVVLFQGLEKSLRLSGTLVVRLL
jgi:hypothetical protein